MNQKMLPKSSSVILNVDNNSNSTERNHKRSPVNWNVLITCFTVALVAVLVLTIHFSSPSQEHERSDRISSDLLDAVRYSSLEENTKMNLADYEDYEEREGEPTAPAITQENEDHSRNKLRLGMYSSYQKANATDDPPRDDSRLRRRRSPRKRDSRSLDVFHNSDEETTYSPPDFRERENSFEHHGSFKHKHLEVLTERHPRVGRIKPLPSAHFSGDTSKYVLGQHPNFNGNGHLKHLQRMFVDWKPSDWAHHTGLDSHFQLNLGVLTVKEAGLFFIYSQIYYLDEHDIIGYKVFKNSDVILQCTITVHTAERRMKGNTCYTAGMEYLHEGDTISIENVYDGRYSLFEPGKSFFGVIKLGDVRIK